MLSFPEDGAVCVRCQQGRGELELSLGLEGSKGSLKARSKGRLLSVRFATALSKAGSELDAEPSSDT